MTVSMANLGEGNRRPLLAQLRLAIVTAALALSIGGAPAMDPDDDVATYATYYGRWLAVIQPRLARGPVEEAGILPALTSIGARLSDKKEIELLRTDRAVADILRLMLKVARSNSYEYRVASMAVLINVTDNTTVCLVEKEITTGDLNESARFNLLQVVKAVAGYMYRENAEDTEQLLRSLRTDPKIDLTKMPRTSALLGEIEAELATSRNRNQSIVKERPELAIKWRQNCRSQS